MLQRLAGRPCHASNGAADRSRTCCFSSSSSRISTARAASRNSKIIFNFLGWLKDQEQLQSTPLLNTPSAFAPASVDEEDGPSLPSPNATESPTAAGSGGPTLSWAGSGLYFFWQLGAMKYLAEHYDLSRVHMAGASGGSLAAVLAACNVPVDKVLRRVYELSLEYDIWERPMGLTGVLGQLVEQWLDDLLPANAHELCRGRVTVVVTTLPDMQQVGISDFKDRQDLINACMASSHVPLVLDLKVTRPCRGRECVDGSFPDFFFGNCDILTRGGAVVFDYFFDKDLKRQGRMDMLSLTSYQAILERVSMGYRYAQRLHGSGSFQGFHLKDIELPADGHVREVMTRDCEDDIKAIAALWAMLKQQQQDQKQQLQLQQKLERQQPKSPSGSSRSARIMQSGLALKQQQQAQQLVQRQQQQQQKLLQKAASAIQSPEGVVVAVAMATAAAEGQQQSEPEEPEVVTAELPAASPQTGGGFYGIFKNFGGNNSRLVAAATAPSRRQP